MFDTVSDFLSQRLYWRRASFSNPKTTQWKCVLSLENPCFYWFSRSLKICYKYARAHILQIRITKNDDKKQKNKLSRQNKSVLVLNQ